MATKIQAFFGIIAVLVVALGLFAFLPVADFDWATATPASFINTNLVPYIYDPFPSPNLPEVFRSAAYALAASSTSDLLENPAPDLAEVVLLFTSPEEAKEALVIFATENFRDGPELASAYHVTISNDPGYKIIARDTPAPTELYTYLWPKNRFLFYVAGTNRDKVEAIVKWVASKYTKTKTVSILTGSRV